MASLIDTRALEKALLALSVHRYPDLPNPPRVPKRASVALILRVRPSPHHSSSKPPPPRSTLNINTRSSTHPTSSQPTANSSSEFVFPPQSFPTTPHPDPLLAPIHPPNATAPAQEDADPDQTYCEITEPSVLPPTGSTPPLVIPEPPLPIPPPSPSPSGSSIQSQIQTFFSLPEVARGQSEILFIKRTSRPTDRWGGHIAFPGGGREAGDDSDERTARRETWEEVGLDLDKLCEQVVEIDGRAGDEKEQGGAREKVQVQGCIPVGALPQRLVSSAWGRSPLLVLCPYVYLLTAPFASPGTSSTSSPSSRQACSLDPFKMQPSEVASVHWVPLRAITEPGNRRVWNYSLQGVCLPRNSRRSPGHVRKQSRPRVSPSAGTTSVSPRPVEPSGPSIAYTHIPAHSRNTSAASASVSLSPLPSPPQSLVKSYIVNPFLQFSEWAASSLDMPAVQLVPGESVWAIPTVSFLSTARQEEHFLLWGLTLGMTAEIVALIEAASLDETFRSDSPAGSLTLFTGAHKTDDQISALTRSRLSLGDTLFDDDALTYASGFDGIDRTDAGYTGADSVQKPLTFYQFAHALPRASKGDVSAWMRVLDFFGIGSKERPSERARLRDGREKGKERRRRRTVGGTLTPGVEGGAAGDGIALGARSKLSGEAAFGEKPRGAGGAEGLESDVRDAKTPVEEGVPLRSTLSPSRLSNVFGDSAVSAGPSSEERGRVPILREPHIDVANVPLAPMEPSSDDIGLRGTYSRPSSLPSSSAHSPSRSQALSQLVLSQSPALRTTLALLATAPSTRATLFARTVAVLRKAVVTAVIARIVVAAIVVGAVGAGLSGAVKGLVRRYQDGIGKGARVGVGRWKEDGREQNRVGGVARIVESGGAEVPALVREGWDMLVRNDRAADGETWRRMLGGHADGSDDGSERGVLGRTGRRWA